MKETEKNNKKNLVTELVFILDRSGSMSGLESDTIGGFNSLIEKQRGIDGECFVTTYLFDHEIEMLHDRESLKDVRSLTDKDYYVRGCTALIDAIGSAIEHIKTVHRYIRKEDVPSNTMFVIITDGYENASHMYSADKVRQMVDEHKKLGWEFLFIGANIDAVETAHNFGIDSDRAVNYNADSVGCDIVYSNVSNAVQNVRMAQPLPTSWSKEINDDFEKRGKKSFLHRNHNKK